METGEGRPPKEGTPPPVAARSGGLSGRASVPGAAVLVSEMRGAVRQETRTTGGFGPASRLRTPGQRL